VPGMGGMRLCLLSDPGVIGDAGDMASMLPKVEARFVEPMEGERLASGRGIGGGTPRDKSVDCLVGAADRSSSDSSPSLGSICVFTGGRGGGAGRPGTWSVKGVTEIYDLLTLGYWWSRHRTSIRYGRWRSALTCWGCKRTLCYKSVSSSNYHIHNLTCLEELEEHDARVQCVVAAEA
jgi:hypothetical protein